ncbi:MAG: class I SAM-dependent methyltransferase [Flavobacteriaceae bacterium]|nr:class I SAM-dependent methyltransferase [Flavobacteriaceae bacterium]
MKQLIQSTLKKLNLRIVKEGTYDNIPQEATEFERFLINQCHQFSMTGNLRMWSIIQAIKHIKHNNIKGDLVECGVWKGANLVLMQNMLEHLSLDNKKIYGYDTFEGMSDSSEFDVDFQDREWTTFSKTIKRDEKVVNAWCVAGIELVRKLYNEFTNENNNLELIKGDVIETLEKEANLPDKISLLRLDTDFYESTKKELEVLYPRLQKGGILIIDDYGHWKGAKKAVDDYFTGEYHFMHVIDYTCRMIIKTE